MKYVLVAAYNNLYNAFMPPQPINEMTDEDIIESNRRAVLAGKIPAEEAKKLTIVKIGYFDDKTGAVTVIQPEELCTLASFLPREQKQVVQEVKEDVTISNN